jgi:hypothetical protein
VPFNSQWDVGRHVKTCFVASDSQTCILGLYEDHGLKGDEVVRFCLETTSSRPYKSRKS